MEFRVIESAVLLYNTEMHVLKPRSDMLCATPSASYGKEGNSIYPHVVCWKRWGHSDIVVKFLHIRSCVMQETKITTKTCHTTNVRDLGSNLSANSELFGRNERCIRMCSTKFLDRMIHLIEGSIFLRLSRPLKQECPKFSVRGARGSGGPEPRY